MEIPKNPRNKGESESEKLRNTRNKDAKPKEQSIAKYQIQGKGGEGGRDEGRGKEHQTSIKKKCLQPRTNFILLHLNQGTCN